MSVAYTDSHASEGYGRRYVGTYSRGYYAAQWRAVEEPLLDRVLADVGGGSCLDVACGTGRITGVARRHFRRVVGVDVSRSMLEQAPAWPGVEYRHADVTAASLGETFDVATAFRFFLKAEPELREAAIRAVHAHLNPGGRLVANIHMQASSPVGMMYRVQGALRGRAHQTLSVDAFSAFLHGHGFEVERVEFYGYCPRPGPALPDLMERLVPAVEKMGRVLPDGTAQCFMVVARKV